jgi:hypothetical protein
VNWGAIRPALLALAVSTTGLSEEDAVQWKGKAPAGQWRRGPRVTMACRSLRVVGTDEERRETVAVDFVTPDIVRISGQRQFTWSLAFEAETAEDDDIAAALANTFLAKLRFQSSRDALAEAGLSVARIEPTQLLEWSSQSKSFSRAVVEVHINSVENVTDDTEGADDFIAAAEWNSAMTGTDGEPSKAQIVDEVSATET